VSPDPETGYLYCIARDITFERSQHEINKTTNELKAILNASEFSIAVDVDGTVKEFNKELKFYGIYSRRTGREKVSSYFPFDKRGSGAFSIFKQGI
jgi:hypothetical protein